MKRKILLAILMALMFTCLFCFSVSAARTENYDAKFILRNESYITHYEKWFYNENKSFVRKRYDDSITVSFVDENGNPITEVAMWEYDEEEKKYYSLVWYISDWEYVTEVQTYTDDNVGTQEYPKYISATYTLSKVRAVDLRYYTHMYGTKKAEIPSWTEERTLKSLEGIYLTNGTPDDTSDDIKLQDAVGIGRDNDNYGYYGWESQFAATGNKIVVANFRDCDFERDVEGNYGTANTWSSATHLQCLWYPDTMKFIGAGIGSVYEIDLGDGMEIIACQILRDNKRVKEIIIPSSVLFLNNEAFRGSDLTRLTIGEGLTVHGGNPFLYTGGADITVLSRNLLKETYKSNIINLIANDKAIIYFNGSLQEAEKLYETILSQRGDTRYYNNIGYYDYTITTERASTNELSIFYNYNTCEAFYKNEHIDDNNPCTVNCSRCGLKSFEENPVHNYVNVIAYTNYLASGVKTQTCQNEGCAHNITPNEVAVNAIIKEFKGISTKENGDGLTFGYIIDYDALDEYMEISGNKVELGFVVAVKAFLGENQPLKENGEKASDKVIKVEIYNSSASDEQIRYTGADFKLTGNWSKTVDLDGDGTEETDIKNVVFYMAGYIMDGNELSYINSDASGKEAGTAYYNQYN